MDENNEGVSEEFKRKVERLCRELEPKNKENNSLWKLITELCKQDLDVMAAENKKKC